jgi:hypothetical protein
LKIYHLATLLQACFNACKLLLPNRRGQEPILRSRVTTPRVA